MKLIGWLLTEKGLPVGGVSADLPVFVHTAL